MPFTPKKTQKKVGTGYKSLYLHRDLIDEIDKLAAKHKTSFNNIVTSMIQQCLDEIKKEEESQ